MSSAWNGVDRRPEVAAVVCGASIIACALWADFPSGYVGDQSATAEHLRTLSRDRALELRAAAGRDLVFAVTYGVAGAGLARALLVLLSSPRDRRWRGRAPAPAFVVLMAGADVVETLLFRASMGRLLAPEDPGALPAATRLFTGVKLGAFFAAILVIVATAVRERRRR